MKLLLIRHAKAQDRRKFAKSCDDDGLRPLTRRGRKRAKRSSKGLIKLLPHIDAIASSPLRRACQTAKLVSRRFAGLEPVEIPELSPGKPPSSLLKWLAQHDPHSTIALVGHEPDLAIFAGWLLSGLEEPLLHLGKGAVCLLEFDQSIAPGQARLRWLLTSRQLRRLSH